MKASYMIINKYDKVFLYNCFIFYYKSSLCFPESVLRRVRGECSSVIERTFPHPDFGVTLNCQSDNTTCSTYARNNGISLKIG